MPTYKLGKSYVINLIGGPGCGKSTIAAILYSKLKLAKYNAELVQEYAKNLVWKGEIYVLNNQEFVTTQQYILLKSVSRGVDLVVTDGPLLHSYYYNHNNPDNLSNIPATDELITRCLRQFNNINIYLRRGNIEYQQEGRLQTESEAMAIDTSLLEILRKYQVNYAEFDAKANDANIQQMLDYITSQIQTSG